MSSGSVYKAEQLAIKHCETSQKSRKGQNANVNTRNTQGGIALRQLHLRTFVVA